MQADRKAFSKLIQCRKVYTVLMCSNNHVIHNEDLEYKEKDTYFSAFPYHVYMTLDSNREIQG